MSRPQGGDHSRRLDPLALLSEAARAMQDFDQPRQAVLQRVAALIPAAFPVPDQCTVCITVGDLRYGTDPLDDRLRRLTVPIGRGADRWGDITVAHPVQSPGAEHGGGVSADQAAWLAVLAEQCALYFAAWCAHDALRRGEALHRERARQTRDMLDALPVLVSYVDREQRYRETNEGYRIWFGLAPESLCGRPIREVLGCSAYDAIRRHVEAALRGETVEFETEVPDAAGGLRSVHATYQPHKAADGTVLGVYAFIQDISERRRAEQALRKSEERFRSVVNVLAEGVVVQDDTGTILSCNPSAERILGLSAEELIGRAAAEATREAVREDGAPVAADEHPVMETLRTGRPRGNVIMGLPRPAGRFVWISMNTQPLVRPGEGRPYGVVSSFADITARKCAEAAFQDLTARLEQLVHARTRELICANQILQQEVAQREAAEAALRRSESGLAEAQRIAKLGSWELDLRTHHLTWSQEIYRIFEVDPALFQPSYETFLASVHPEDRARVDACYQASVRTQQPYEIIHRVVTPGGRVKYVHERGETLYDDRRHPVRTIGTVQDVTERKRAEDALRKLQAELEDRVHQRTEELSAANYQLLVEIEERIKAQDTRLRHDRILEAVSFAAKQFLLNAWSKERLRDVLHRLGEAAAADHVCVFQNDVDDAGDLRTSLTAEWVAPGIPTRINDERLQHLSYRDRGLSRWGTLLSSGMSVVGEVADWPPAEREVMAVRGQRTAALVPIFVGETWWGFMIFGLVREQRVWQAAEIEALQVAASTFGAGIQRRQMEEQIALYTDKLEQLVAQRTIRIQELEQQRAQVDKLAAVGQLAAGVAHEINNPIAGIKNAFLVLKDSIPRDHPHYRFVGMIEREIERVAKIVRTLYDLYRPESARRVPIALDTLVQDLLYLVQPKLVQKRVTLRRTITVPATDSRLVPRDLLQVLLNLIQNAIDVSPNGGEIRLDVTMEDDTMRVAVVDRGPGIEAEVLPHIFEPFYSRKTGGGQPGMGLGLSVCYGLVQAMGGCIDVETGARGTTFIVRVPCAAATPSLAERETEDEPFGRTHPDRG